MKYEIAKIAKEFMESSAYILEGYLDMCQADLPRRKRCWLELEMDQEAYTDGSKVHLGLFTLKDIYEFFMSHYPSTDPAAFFAILNQYLLGHENQHTRSTRDKDWQAALQIGKKTIIRGISKSRGDGKVFKNEKDYDAYIEQLRASGVDINMSQIEMLCHYVTNSIEDGRIERIRSVKRPGFGTTMRLVRSTIYEMCDASDYLKEQDPTLPYPVKLDPAKLSKDKGLNVLLGQILSLATCSVYEKNFFNLFAGTEIGQDAHKLIAPIRSGVNSGCCRGIVAASEAVLEILLPYIVASVKERDLSQTTEEAQCKMEKTGSGSTSEQHTLKGNEEETDDGTSQSVVKPIGETGEETLNSGGFSAGESPTQAIESKNQPMQNGEGNNGGQQNTKAPDHEEEDVNSTPSGSEIKVNPFEEREAKASEGTEQELKDAIQEAMKAAASQMEGISGQISAHKAETKKKIAACKTTKLPEFKPNKAAKVFPGIRFAEVYRQYKLDTPMPFDLQVRADKFSNDIEDLFKNQEIPQIRCVNTGKIDAANIYKLGMNMIDCFEQEQESPEFSGCAYFLCDNSGSMGYGKGSKRYYANTALSVIEQGFSKHMPIKMTAFDSNGRGIVHEVLKNWDEELPVSGAYNFAIKGRRGGGNADGYSIRVATEELLERSEEEKMLVVLSDGAPSQVTYGSKMKAEDEVRMAVEEARAAGIRVISIYFENAGYRTPEVFEYMYGKHESIICEPDEVEDHLAALMQTFVFG